MVLVGDRVEFVASEGEVRLVTARSRLEAIWANNHGGDTGDSTVDVRHGRMEDIAQHEAKQARVEARLAEESRTEEEITGDLLRSLGLA